MKERILDYVISYPKCGRTWLRFMYDRYIQEFFNFPGQNIFDMEEQLTYYYSTNWTHIGCAPSERKMWHQVGAIDPNVFNNRTCVVMMRNIPDTLVSLYYHSQFRSEVQYKGSISDFIRDPMLGVLKICAYYEVVNNFLDLQDVIKIRYEALHKNPKSVLTGLLKKLKVEVNPNLVDKVIKEGSFDNMKALSQTKQYKNTWLDATDQNNAQSAKVRNGKVGEGDKTFSTDDMNYIKQTVRLVLGTECI